MYIYCSIPIARFTLQGWEFALTLICSFSFAHLLFALSLIRSILFHSKSLRLKSDHEWFAQVAHDKRVTVNVSLSSLLTKERPWAISSGCSGQKSDVGELLSSLMTKERHEWFAHCSSKLLSKSSTSPEKNGKNRIFHMFLTVFPFLCPKALRSHRSFLSCSFLMSNMSDLITLLFTKERTWANRSGHSLQKSNRERFAHVAL